jgi:hypothetical protein
MGITQHPEFSKIADLVEKRLSAEESPAVLAHLAACDICADAQRQLEKAISLMRARDLEDAPRPAIAQVIGLFKPRAKQSTSLLERLVALLKFDSQQMMPAYGVRSGAAAERQLLFTAGERELHLQIAGVSDEWVITGQILGDCQSGEVEIKNPLVTRHTSLNELCEFTLPSIPAGSYALTLRLNNIEIEVPNLDLGA